MYNVHKTPSALCCSPWRFKIDMAFKIRQGRRKVRVVLLLKKKRKTYFFLKIIDNN